MCELLRMGGGEVKTGGQAGGIKQTVTQAAMGTANFLLPLPMTDASLRTWRTALDLVIIGLGSAWLARVQPHTLWPLAPGL